MPGSAKPDPILEVNNIVRQFGGMTAVDVDHLEVQRGIITALIGPNGAGKTTFFNLITGFDRPTSARAGRALVVRRPDPRQDLGVERGPAGMVRTFQLTKALNRMTVMRQHDARRASSRRARTSLKSMFKPLWSGQEREIEAKAEELLERFKLLEKKNDYAGSLSGGQRKLLEMARALMSDPTMIMLDEPMAGVNPALTQSLLGHIQSLRDEGMTVLFVEHDMHVVRHISDWVVGDGRGADRGRGLGRHGDVGPRRDRRLPRCPPRHRPRRRRVAREEALAEIAEEVAAAEAGARRGDEGAPGRPSGGEEKQK